VRLTAERALLAFHWRAGTRAALRATTIGVALVIFAVGMTPIPLEFLTDTTRALVGPARGEGTRLVVARFRTRLEGVAPGAASLESRRLTTPLHRQLLVVG